MSRSDPPHRRPRPRRLACGCSFLKRSPARCATYRELARGLAEAWEVARRGGPPEPYRALRNALKAHAKGREPEPYSPL